MPSKLATMCTLLLHCELQLLLCFGYVLYVAERYLDESVLFFGSFSLRSLPELIRFLLTVDELFGFFGSFSLKSLPKLMRF